MAAGDRPLVLVAEDDPDILELIGTCLRSIDCEVIRAQDGHTAHALARRERPRVAVLDIRMPRLDGLELTRRLKADPDLSSIAVLVLTASVDGNQPRRALAAGADDYLSKPFTATALRQAVTRLIRDS